MMVIPNRARVVAVLAALALAGGLLTLALLANPAPARAQTETSNEWIPIVDKLVSKPCTGELISFDGTVHVVGATTQDADGNLHFHGYTNLVGGEGVGLRSGAEYAIREVSNGGQTFDSDQAPAIFTQMYTNRSTRKGSPTPEDDFVFKTFIQFTINANGEVTAGVDKFEEECT